MTEQEPKPSNSGELKPSINLEFLRTLKVLPDCSFDKPKEAEDGK